MQCRIPQTSHKPCFYICKENHLHWCLGIIDVDADTLPMQERLQIEWFNQCLNNEERKFWNPYFREIDSLIAAFLRESEQRDDSTMQRREESYRAAILKVYDKGIDTYARMTGTHPQEEICMAVCCAPAQIAITLISNVRTTSVIKWIDTGTVWRQVHLTGKEPEYFTYSPGSQVTVSPGATYYYKLVTNNGRETKRLLAPQIGDDVTRIVLPWQ